MAQAQKSESRIRKSEFSNIKKTYGIQKANYDDFKANILNSDS